MVAALRDGGAAELTPGGVADLERVVQVAAGRLRVDLRLDGELDALPPAVAAAVYRIVQESVTNAMRHAVDATEVAVHVAGEPRAVRVTVRDNGARASRAGRDGYGLAGLRERAALLGGELYAGPAADRGWCGGRASLGEGRRQWQSASWSLTTRRSSVPGCGSCWMPSPISRWSARRPTDSRP